MSRTGNLRLPGVCVFFLLAGCASLPVSDFKKGETDPGFDKIFLGRTHSEGVMENRGGAPLERVTTETFGRWEGDTLVLERELRVGDSAPQHRSWRIRKLDAHRSAATAGDMVGTARGEAQGNVFHWQFTLALARGHPFGNVRMSQWMYLQPDGRTLRNHSTIRKFGVVVAQVTEQFRKK